MSGHTPANTTSQTTTELPAWAQPYATSLLQRGADLSNQNMPVYTGQRSANLNNFQKLGMGMATDRALSGSSEVSAGSQALQGTLGGQYLNHSAGTNAYMGDNPYLQSTIDKAAGDITRNYDSAVNGTDATMARAGAFGGSAWQQAQNDNSRNLANSLAGSADNLRMQNYNQSAGLAESALGRDEAGYQAERQRQLGAMPLALQYGNQAYTDAAQLQGVGDTQYGADQQQLTDAMNQWNEQAQAPYKSLDVLGNTIRAAVGGGSSVSQTGPGSNPLMQGVGGAAALYSLFGK